MLDMPSNTWEEVGEMSTSRSALSSMVVTFNSLLEEVREGLMWQKEDEKMDGVVEGGTEDVAMNEDSLVEYGEQLKSDLSYIEYPDTPDDSDGSDTYDIVHGG